MDNADKYQENVIEVNIGDMFWSIIRRWRSTICLMLIFGVFLCGYNGLKEYKNYKDKDANAAREEAYEAELAAYERNKTAYETQIQNLQGSIDRLDYYQQNSIMLLMDPYNVYKQTITYYVDTDYEIMPDVFFQNPNYTETIVKSYKLAIDRLDFDTLIDLPGEADLTVDHLVKSQQDKSVYSIDIDESLGIIKISVIGDSEKRTQQLMNAIRQEMEKQKELLSVAIGEHELTVISEGSERSIDQDLAALQNSFAKDYEENVSTIEKTEKKLNELEEPTKTVISKKSVIMTGIKYGIVGLFLGLILAWVILFFRYIFNDRLYNVNDLHKRYHLPVLGVLSLGKQKCRIDQKINANLGIPYEQKEEDAIAYIVSNVRYYLKEAKKILLMGTVSEETLEAVKGKLDQKLSDVEIEVGGNLNRSSAAIESLSADAAVIFVEEWQKAKNLEIRRELDTAAASDNLGISFIVIAE